MPPRTTLVLLLTLFISSALHAQTAADAAVLALFEKRCAECHKDDEEPTLHGAMSLRTLRDDPKYVTPGKADTSELFVRTTLPSDTKKRMPKSKGAPSDEDYRATLTIEEIQTLRTWIEGDATSRLTARPFITDDAINNAILADLEKLTPRDALPLVRYLTLTNLANTPDASGSARFTDAEIALYRGAADKLLNSLSWRSDIVRAVPIDPQKTILRIYLPSYGWTAEFWERLISFYPYAILSGSKPERDAAALTHTALPRVRADWFVFALAQPPLYHEALELPGSDGQGGADTALEKQLGVALTRNLQGGRALRSGFEKSGVSQGNRMIERHPQRDGGAYWKSYDFDPKRKDQPGGDLFAAPLGPVGAGLTADSSHEFQHDGGEIIFNLPNGLQAYLLTDAKGKRLNHAPTNIVHDTSRPDSVIINGVSCMSCHHSGMFPPPADEVARVATAALRGDDATLVSTLYQQPAIAKAIDNDSARFIAAMAKCGVGSAASAKDEPVRALYDRFRADITQQQLASEFGQSSEHFLSDLKRSKEERVRLLAAKLEQNVTIPRQSFISNFELIAGALALGDLRNFEPPPFEEFRGGKDVGKVPELSGVITDGKIGDTRSIELGGGAKIELCYCPAGTFTMGSLSTEDHRNDDEDQVAVKISKGFWIAESECTQRQWERIMEKNPSKFSGSTDLPVEQVTWDEVQEFIGKLNSASLFEGHRWALPTEAQWEYACRAGTNTAFAYGDILTKEMRGPHITKTEKVKSYRPNTWGLYDMHGNVEEWCADWYAKFREGGTNPMGPSTGAWRVTRGGGFDSVDSSLRSASRAGYEPDDGRRSTVGFRVIAVPVGR